MFIDFNSHNNYLKIKKINSVYGKTVYKDEIKREGVSYERKWKKKTQPNNIYVVCTGPKGVEIK